MGEVIFLGGGGMQNRASSKDANQCTGKILAHSLVNFAVNEASKTN